MRNSEFDHSAAAMAALTVMPEGKDRKETAHDNDRTPRTRKFLNCIDVRLNGMPQKMRQQK
jgi:hypothetical protein